MKKYLLHALHVLVFFFISLLYSCEEVRSNNRSKVASLDKLISHNRKNILFLDFWFGMTKEEFELIINHNLDQEKIIATEDEEPEYIYQLLIERSDRSNRYTDTEAIETKVKFDFDSTNLLREIRLYILPAKQYIEEELPEISAKRYLSNDCADRIVALYKAKYGEPVRNGLTQYENLQAQLPNLEVLEWIKDQKLISILQEIDCVYTKDNEFYNAQQIVEKQLASISILYTNHTYFKQNIEKREQLDSITHHRHRIEMTEKLEEI